MLLTILSCFVLAASMLFLGRLVKKNFAPFMALLPLGIFIYFLSFIPKISAQKFIHQNVQWVPSFGVNLDFYLDGLSLIFCLMISGIGALVFLYTASYLKNHPFLDRFYAYLSIFMGAMLGVVLSQNLITLFIFWEITSISSFFLIGFNNEQEGSRKSALTALCITGIGGLCLLVAAILMGNVAGSYNILNIQLSENILKNSNLYSAIVLLIFGAAFTKSAQFPFHFWLPGAMKAPTPVSTYLHSATMVKAGIYLLLRLSPTLSGTALWNGTLTLIGGFTMLYAAIHTLFRLDMKGVLAYSTISALGILTFLIGIGSDAAILAAVVFLLIHATYKAPLFLITGIIDHETKTRNLTELSGLSKVMMPVAIMAFFAALSHGGVIPTFGFVGKDLIYESLLNDNFLIIIAIISNALLLYAGLATGFKPFWGKLPERYKNLHMPDIYMWLPPAILSALCLILGIYPALVQHSLIEPALASLGKNTVFHLKLWHGFNKVLMLSLLTMGLGFAIFALMKPSQKKEEFIKKFNKISPHHIILRLTDAFCAFSSFLTKKIQGGHLTTYVKNTILCATILICIGLFDRFSYRLDYQSFSELTIHEVVILIVLIVAILFTTFTKSRLAAVAAMGLMSFSMCMIFMMYSAPDLAMTQFSIDTLTVVLFVLMLYKLPYYLKLHTQKTQMLDGFLALCFGVVISLTCLEVLSTPQNTEVSSFYAQNSYIAAHGKNIVNVILVDFRGADTMMEISVLSIAAIGVFGLIKLRLKTKERFKA